MKSDVNATHADLAEPHALAAAEVLKTLSNPRRLEILHLLADGPREVSRLAEELGISQPNVSQHLALLRSAGMADVLADRAAAANDTD